MLSKGKILLVDDEEDIRDLIEITMHDQTVGTAHRHTAIGHAADFGTLFCALAGLINFAVALDAGGRATPDRRGGGR